MDCEQFLSQMSEFLDGELSGAAAEEFQQHSATCARCRTALATVQQMRRLYADERFFAMSAGARERLRQALATGLDEPLAPVELRPATMRPHETAAPSRRSWIGFGADTGRLRAITWAAAAAVVLLAVSVARWQAAAATTSGWLMDSHCYASFKTHPGDHPADCLIKCAKKDNALGLVDAQGHFHPFDTQGMAKALAATEASHRKDHLWVTVKARPAKGTTLDVIALTLGEPATR